MNSNQLPLLQNDRIYGRESTPIKATLYSMKKPAGI